MLADTIGLDDVPTPFGDRLDEVQPAFHVFEAIPAMSIERGARRHHHHARAVLPGIHQIRYLARNTDRLGDDERYLTGGNFVSLRHRHGLSLLSRDDEVNIRLVYPRIQNRPLR